jgi:hypothetical protein
VGVHGIADRCCAGATWTQGSLDCGTVELSLEFGAG